MKNAKCKNCLYAKDACNNTKKWCWLWSMNDSFARTDIFGNLRTIIDVEKDINIYGPRKDIYEGYGKNGNINVLGICVDLEDICDFYTIKT